MLIVFSGLPGTGKTTIASDLATRISAVYLRIDTIEQAIRNSGVLAQDVGCSGYMVANELAPPTWQSVLSHEYEEWDNTPFNIDTALMSPTEAVAMITKRFLSEE